MNKRRKTIYTSWSMPDPAKNYVPLPKGIYRIGLSGEEIAIYGYLFSLENENYQCWPSYETIGKAVNMSKRTVMKYVSLLEERGLITTEHTTVTLRDGTKRNGTLKYCIRPIQEALDLFYEHQMTIAESIAERQRAAKLLAKKPPVCPVKAACAIFGDDAGTVPAEAV